MDRIQSESTRAEIATTGQSGSPARRDANGNPIGEPLPAWLPRMAPPREAKGRTRDTSWYSVIDSEWPALESAFQGWLDAANFHQSGRQRRALASFRLDESRPTIDARRSDR